MIEVSPLPPAELQILPIRYDDFVDVRHHVAQNVVASLKTYAGVDSYAGLLALGSEEVRRQTADAYSQGKLGDRSLAYLARAVSSRTGHDLPRGKTPPGMLPKLFTDATLVPVSYALPTPNAPALSTYYDLGLPRGKPWAIGELLRDLPETEGLIGVLPGAENPVDFYKFLAGLWRQVIEPFDAAVRATSR